MYVKPNAASFHNLLPKTLNPSDLQQHCTLFDVHQLQRHHQRTEGALFKVSSLSDGSVDSENVCQTLLRVNCTQHLFILLLLAVSHLQYVPVRQVLHQH